VTAVYTKQQYLQDNSSSRVSIAIQLLVRPPPQRRMDHPGRQKVRMSVAWTAAIGDVLRSSVTPARVRSSLSWRRAVDVFDNRQWVVKRCICDTRHWLVNRPVCLHAARFCPCSPRLRGTNGRHQRLMHVSRRVVFARRLTCEFLSVQLVYEELTYISRRWRVNILYLRWKLSAPMCSYRICKVHWQLCGLKVSACASGMFTALYRI